MDEMIVAIEKPGSPEELAETLIHVGVKGMHWGIRKEYKTSDWKPAKKISVRKERRAKGHSDQAAVAQKKIDELKKMPATGAFTQFNRNRTTKHLEKHRDVQVKAASDIRAGHLTDFQKRAIIGAAVTGTVLAAYGTFKLVDSGTAHQILNKNTFTKKNDLLTRTMSHDQLMKEVVLPINKGESFGYGTEVGRQMNCRRCTFAYEARRRGYDVEATKTIFGTGQTPAGLLNASDPKSHFNTLNIGHIINSKKKGPVRTIMSSNEGLGRRAVDPAFLSMDKHEKAQSMFDAISSHGAGSRGELAVNWKFGGAHSLAWENMGGKPVIFDAQTGDSYRTVEDVAHRLTGHVKNAGITRLDNIPLNTDFLKRWVTNVE